MSDLHEEEEEAIVEDALELKSENDQSGENRKNWNIQQVRNVVSKLAFNPFLLMLLHFFRNIGIQMSISRTGLRLIKYFF